MVFATFTYFYAAICNIAASEIVPGKYQGLLIIIGHIWNIARINVELFHYQSYFFLNVFLILSTWPSRCWLIKVKTNTFLRHQSFLSQTNNRNAKVQG